MTFDEVFRSLPTSARANRARALVSLSLTHCVSCRGHAKTSKLHYSATMESYEELFKASQKIEAGYDVGQFVHATENEDERFFVSSADDLTVPESTRRREKWASGVFTAWAVSRNNRHSQEDRIMNKLEAMTDPNSLNQTYEVIHYSNPIISSLMLIVFILSK